MNDYCMAGLWSITVIASHGAMASVGEIRPIVRAARNDRLPAADAGRGRFA